MKPIDAILIGSFVAPVLIQLTGIKLAIQKHACVTSCPQQVTNNIRIYIDGNAVSLRRDHIVDNNKYTIKTNQDGSIYAIEVEPYFFRQVDNTKETLK